MENIYAKLREIVEIHAGRKMQTPRDFDYLTHCIWEMLHVQISPTTLKRFWGYLHTETIQNPRLFTLNTLAQLVGYHDWAHCLESIQTGNNEVESCFVKDTILYTRTLTEGTKIQLTWAPNRVVTIELKGQDLFVVTESINSKLSVGDTFICPSFQQGETLFLHCLVHEGGTPTDYICGKSNGVRFEVHSKYSADDTNTQDL
jgi:hypothetical protein